MNNVLVSLFVLSTVLHSCMQNTKETRIAEVSSSMDDSTIVVIPFDRLKNWPFNNSYIPASLTGKEMEEIDSLINIGISEYNKSLTSQARNDYGIDLKKYKYRKQYVAALNERGEKEVWVNGFCSTIGETWRKEILLAKDGGNCYFNLKINLMTRKCFDISVNGYA